MMSKSESMHISSYSENILAIIMLFPLVNVPNIANFYHYVFLDIWKIWFRGKFSRAGILGTKNSILEINLPYKTEASLA